MRFKKHIIHFAFIASLALISPDISAAAQTVAVTKAPFPIQLNGITIDNQYAQYPLLLYKDITYVPMTWDYAQALGLDIHWSRNYGLTNHLFPADLAIYP